MSEIPFIWILRKKKKIIFINSVQLIHTLITVKIVRFPLIFQALLIRREANIAISVTMSKLNYNHSTPEGEILTKYIKKTTSLPARRFHALLSL